MKNYAALGRGIPEPLSPFSPRYCSLSASVATVSWFVMLRNANL
jgi:hypothetical protein